jgi:hypothetical protein
MDVRVSFDNFFRLIIHRIAAATARIVIQWASMSRWVIYQILPQLCYNQNMELPDNCSNCDHVNMIDWSKLESRPLAGLYTVSGYTCKKCGKWKPCYYSNRLLDESLRKLESISPKNRSFEFHFRKLVKRAIDIQERGMAAHGASRCKNMA